VNQRVALTRPTEDAARSGALLQARGFEPIFAPIMAIAATGAPAPDEKFDAVLATSANAFAFLSPRARAALSRLKLYAAGERTAAAALAAGLGPADEASPDAAALARLLVSRLAPGSRLLYLTARDRKSDLESALSAAGHRVVAMEVYVAQARAGWSAAEAEALLTCGAALHYSRRSAELTVVLAGRAGLSEHWRATLHVCISKDSAEPLRSIGARRIVAAAGAQESLLIDALVAAARNS